MKKDITLKKKICWSLFFLFIVEIGKNICLPGFLYNQETIINQNILTRLLSSSTGGQYAVPTLFSLGMSPYMTGLIIWSTITMIDSDRINHLSIKKRSFYQKFIVLFFAFLQAIALIYRFRDTVHYELFSGLSQIQVLGILSIVLTTGGMLLSWIADINCEKGIGAQSIFIIPSLISNLPAMLTSGQSKSLIYSHWQIFVLVAITLVFIYVTLFFYKAEYRIFFERTGIDSQLNHPYIPIRLLTAGAMPYMFATTIFSLPQLLLLNKSLSNTSFSNFLTVFFSFNTYQGVLMYGVIIFSLAIGFSFVNVRPHDIAKNMKYSGDYIVDVLPGKPTEKYIQNKLLKVASFGNSYLVLVSLVPLFIGLKIPYVSNLALYFGSTFMLIIILDNLYQELEFLYFRKAYTIF